MGMGCGVLDKGNKEKGKGTKFIAKSEWRKANGEQRMVPALQDH